MPEVMRAAVMETSPCNAFKLASLIEEEPWVLLYNPFCQDPDTGGGQIFQILLAPFPAKDFPPHSPWMDNTVLAWAPSAQRLSAAAGWRDVPSYVHHIIKEAALRPR